MCGVEQLRSTRYSCLMEPLSSDKFPAMKTDGPSSAPESVITYLLTGEMYQSFIVTMRTYRLI